MAPNPLPQGFVPSYGLPAAAEPVDPALVSRMTSDGTLYGEEYFARRCGDRPYRKGEPKWEAYFAGIADNIVRCFSPRTVFDAGCALGLLVEALWDCGVEAHGRDVSQYAITHVRSDIRDYCIVGSITDPIHDSYDLVTCIEVLEHLSPEDADLAIDRMTGATDRILFSSTPTDVAEPTYQTVRPPIYWLRRFAQRGYSPILAHDATYVSPYAFLLERSGSSVPEDVLIGAAELAQLRTKFHSTVGVDGAVGQRSARRYRKAAFDGVERELDRRYTLLVREVELKSREVKKAREELRALEETKILRYTNLLRRIYGRVHAKLRHRSSTPVPGHPGVDLQQPVYDQWMELFDRVEQDRRRVLETRIAALECSPLVSIVMPVYDTPERYLREAIESVLAQIYREWELCIVDDASTASWVATVLQEYAALDQRVKVVRREANGHISAATNTGIAHARGDWVTLLDHDDILAEHALALAVLAIVGNPDAGLLYSDEDKLDEVGQRWMPFFKPDFDPLLLLAQNYVSHMTMIRRDLIEKVGGLREGLEGSQDWDLVLRVTEHLRSDQVIHLPQVLYHWRAHAGSTALARAAKPYAARAGARAVAEHLARRGKDVDVVVNDVTGILRTKWRIPPSPPKVSVIIPTRDGKYLARCLQSLFAMTVYSDFEVFVIDNGSTSDEMLSLLHNYEGVATIIRDDREFNFSALNNAAAAHCTGDVLCFMNDDCEVTEQGWLEELVGQLTEEDVGVAGAMLLYPDGRVQHAGVVLGIGGVAGHVHRYSERYADRQFGWLMTHRSLSAVTAACMVVRRPLFEQLGGFDAVNVGVAFSDVDFCLRVREAGWRVVWTPHALLIHHESVSRGLDHVVRPRAFRKEVGYMQDRWGDLLVGDPAYSPNLSLESIEFDLAFPPRELWWAM